MEFQDYYAVLGVPRNADDKQIRAAFRKLARQHHPDVNPGNQAAEDRFKQVNEAYEVLSDPEKRRRYDEVGEHWREYEQWQQAQAAAGRPGAPNEWPGFGGATGFGGGRPGYEYRSVSEDDLRDLFGEDAPFSDFFETLFGAQGGAAGPAGRGGPTGPAGRGGAAGAAGRGGAAGGRRRTRAGADLEHPIDVSLADAYRGTTTLLAIQQPDGTTRRIEVRIPPGVATGSRVRVAGQGGPGEDGAPSGDLYLVVSVRPDSRFERRGDDLATEVRAPLRTLLLGGEARVGTPDGRTLALRIPAGSQDGRVFRLRGQGMPHLGAPERHGDLHAEVHAEMPERLTPAQRRLLEEAFGAEAERPVGAGA